VRDGTAVSSPLRFAFATFSLYITRVPIICYLLLGYRSRNAVESKLLSECLNLEILLLKYRIVVDYLPLETNLFQSLNPVLREMVL
jgi:hypothetical protein